MSFYRIYRPQVIEEIDNVAVRDTLLSLLTKPKKDLPHAYFFSGPRGAGKTTAARVIAKIFNCEKFTKTGPCGKCEQCSTIAQGRNLDVLELDAASNRGIDEIRQLRDGIALTPVSGTHKIYIIDEVHMLTTEAFNALLKTLEEPPAHAVFVLATTDPHKVPVTITSRCMMFGFSKASTAELTHALSRIVQKEKLSIDKEALMLLVSSVDGSFRDGVKLLEQASFHKGNITKEILERMLSFSTMATVREFVGAFLASDAKKCLELIQTMVAGGVDIKVFLVQSLELLHGMLLVDIANMDLDGALRKLATAYSQMRGSPIVQLPLELAVVEFCAEKKTLVASTVVVKPVEIPKEQGSLTLDHLVNHWTDIITELKPLNHSVAGVLRSARPAGIKDGIVTIEAFYTFHKDKLSETKSRETIALVLKKLFGENVRVEIVLGKK